MQMVYVMEMKLFEVHVDDVDDKCDVDDVDG